MATTRTLLGLGGLLVLAGIVGVAPAQPKEPPTAIPWGISSSASSFRNHAEWFPKMAEAGIATVRLFPEWRGFEPKRGTWNWEAGDRLVKNAAANKIEINGILMGSPPGTKASHAFPMDDLDGWSRYVEAVVGRYMDRIRYWEVWNEGNGGFNDGKHTTTDYAKLAITTYEAAKKASPDAQVGLTVASFDAPYLDHAIRAMAKAGKPDRFDFLCIHPYEIADGLAGIDGEIPFLWMTHTLREMLKRSAPERADAEVWITEVGRRIDTQRNPPVTEENAAQALVKMYTMSVAQGIARVQWFEAQDPAGEEPGFGLLNRQGTPRASHQALKTLTSLLGPRPKYLGWLVLGRGGRGYGFVFAGKVGPVLVAWMPAGLTDDTLTFTGDVEVTDVGGKARSVKAGQPLALTDAPMFVVGLPAEVGKQAQANAGKNFPWGGDYSTRKTVQCQLGQSDGNDGIFPAGRGQYPSVKFPDGSTGLLLEGDINHPVPFFVHPSFASFATREYHVRVTVRRVAAGNVGMNLIYEVADSGGRSPYANVGKWFGTSKDAGWQTYTWHVTDACFAKMWGHDLLIRPEQSVPFALGKIEVSTEPFE